MLVEIVGILNPTDSDEVVDLGCGTGNLPLAIRRHGVDCAVMGIDSSPSMLARAKIKCGQTVSFFKADLDMPLRNQGISRSFDCLVMVNSLYSTSNPNAALRHAAGIAKAEAILVVSTPRAGAKPLEILRAHGDLARAQNKPAHTSRMFVSLFAVYLINLVIKRLGEAGPYHFATEDDIRKWFSYSGWKVMEVTKTYGDQNWLITARRTPAYRARKAFSPEDRAAAFGVRHAAYCESVLRAPALMECPVVQPDSPHDEYDSSPNCDIYIVEDDQGLVVGSARLIRYSELGHQAENFVVLPADIDKAMHRELSRLALSPLLKGATERRLALLSLLGKVVLDSIDDGCTTWIMTMRGGVLRMLSGLSMPIRLLDVKPITFHNGPVKGGPLSGESLYLASIDLSEVQIAMSVGSPVAYEQMFPGLRPPTDARQREMGPILLKRVQDNLIMLDNHVTRRE
jgi:ubiquinone/menaquinone biosynthesis C-methylase UbiE